MNAHPYLVAVSPEPIQSLNDRVLLDAWTSEQDHEAFAALVLRYASLVLGVCRRQCRHIQDVDDAFQGTFLCLMRNASKIRKPDELAAWLHGTAYRTAVAARRRERDHVTGLVEDPPMENDPLIQVSRRHELRILDEELSRLDEPYRSAIVLHWIEGLATAEVADQLRVTTDVIRGRLQRGRAQLELRLRRRGVTAFSVMAALAAWPVDHAAAASGADRFITTQFDPITPTNTGSDLSANNASLESLLETGTSTMTWTMTIGCTAALAFAAIASLASWTDNGNAQTVLSSGAIAGEAGNATSQYPSHWSGLGTSSCGDASTNIGQERRCGYASQAKRTSYRYKASNASSLDRNTDARDSQLCNQRRDDFKSRRSIARGDWLADCDRSTRH